MRIEIIKLFLETFMYIIFNSSSGRLKSLWGQPTTIHKKIGLRDQIIFLSPTPKKGNIINWLSENVDLEK
jgi:hypothetical protein